MALHTVAAGRAWVYSHHVGRQGLVGTGFSQPVGVAVAKGGVMYVANRSGEQNPSTRITKATVDQEFINEFGRRVHDNGSGTDHGAAGVSFFIGDPIKGGMYGEYPSRKAEHLEQGDLVPNYDFRGSYTTIVEDWFKMDARPIVNGNFEKMAVLK